MYFVQFLRDAGVNATADLEHEAGHVLFAVTPDSKDVALDKIREALAIYLRLPANPGAGMNLVSLGDIQTQQLVANVQHLQTQLMLAGAIIQAKDATIQTQQVTTSTQQKITNGEVMRDSFRGLVEGREKEELLGGALTLTKYEGKGFEVNIPKIFRYLRNLFSEGQEQGNTSNEAPSRGDPPDT